jgi:hypothetical protein
MSQTTPGQTVPIPPPPRVSRGYGKDWQFAAKILQAPIVRNSAVILTIGPVVFWAYQALQSTGIVFPSIWRFWVAWLAAVCITVSYALLIWKCPPLIKKYKNYAEYAAEMHSHRWILWQAYQYLRELDQRDAVAAEFLTKGLSQPATGWAGLMSQTAEVPSTQTTRGLRLFKPINQGRDLIIPIEFDQDQLVITLEEADPILAAKEKEAFWILFTSQAKSRPISRALVWIFAYAGLLLLVIPTVWNVARVVYMAVQALCFDV